MKVFLISGKAQNGKDTLGKYMWIDLNSRGKKALIIHYADLLKFYCKTYFGWDGEKNEEGRTLLQLVGTDIVRAKEPDYWAESVSHFLSLFADQIEYAIIPDCRFVNEMEIPKSKFDCTTIRVERPNFDNGLTEEQKSHISETALDDYQVDYVVLNDGTEEELYGPAKIIIDKVLGVEEGEPTNDTN